MRTDYPTGISESAEPKIGLIFLAQRLEELTSPRSLDSYKAYTVNVPTLLKEAVEQIEAIHHSGPGISSSSADCILEELTKRTGGNIVSNTMLGTSRELTNKLRALTAENSLATLKMLSQEISGWAYVTQVMNEISISIDDKSKDKIDYLANELVSGLINLGMSRRHINEEIVKFFWDKESSVLSKENLKTFFRSIFPHHHDFKIYCRVSALPLNLRNEEFPPFKTQFLTELPQKLKNMVKNKEGFGNNLACYSVTSGIRALDRYAAIEIARKRVSLMQNLIRMYNHEINFEIDDVVIVEQCCSDEAKVVLPEQYIRRPVTDVAKPAAVTRLKNVVFGSNFMQGGIYSKFTSVCEFHGHSMDASSIENKLLNIWISLETICPSLSGNSKIDNVVSGAKCTLSLNYIKRLMQSVVFDLNLWDRAEIKAILESIGGKDRLQIESFILLLLKKDNEVALRDLLAKLDGQELLRNRIFKLHQSFCSVDNINNTMDSHLERVGWQIRRIYRARNQIVHLGKVPEFVSSLVDSAHDYFDQILTTIVDSSLGPNGFKDFDAAFTYMHWENDTYRNNLSRIDFAKDEDIISMLWRRRRAIARYDVIIPPTL